MRGPLVVLQRGVEWISALVRLCYGCVGVDRLYPLYQRWRGGSRLPLPIARTFAAALIGRYPSGFV